MVTLRSQEVKQEAQKLNSSVVALVLAKMIKALMQEDRTLKELVEITQMNESTVRRHMYALRTIGLVEVYRSHKGNTPLQFHWKDFNEQWNPPKQQLEKALPSWMRCKIWRVRQQHKQGKISDTVLQLRESELLKDFYSGKLKKGAARKLGQTIPLKDTAAYKREEARKRGLL